MQISGALKLVFIAALIISDLVYVNVKVILDTDLRIYYILWTGVSLLCI